MDSSNKKSNRMLTEAELQQKVNDIINAPEEFIEAAYDWFFAPENKGGIDSMLREATITGAYYEYLEVGLKDLIDADK